MIALRRKEHGFTLLEVLVAMSILVMSFAALFGHEGVAIQMSDYSNRARQATLLAQAKMYDLEFKLLDDSIDLYDNCDSGDFRKEGFKQFKWKVCAYKLELEGGATDQITDRFLNMLTGYGINADGSGTMGAMTESVSMQISMAIAALPSFLEKLEEKIRKVHLEVSWTDMVATREITIERFVTALGSDPTDGPPPADGDAADSTDTDALINKLESHLGGSK